MSTPIPGGTPPRAPSPRASSRGVIVTASTPSLRGGGWCAKRSGTGDDGRVGTSAPFGPRAVVDRRFRCAGEVKAEADDACRDARAAARSDLLRRIDPRCRYARLELV